MPRFTDQDNLTFIVPDGDYEFTVVDMETGMATSGKMNGTEYWEMTLRVKAPNGSILDVRDKLYDSPKWLWKCDTFLKCCNVAVPKGADYEFVEEIAKSKGVAWVNVFGLRGVCRLQKNTYKKQDGTEASNMRVEVYWTNKTKLARDTSVVPPEPVAEEDNPEVPF